MISMVKAVQIAPELRAYLVDIAEATRNHPAIELGMSPRATLNLQQVSRAHALASQRPYVTDDDVKAVAAAVVSHRIVLRPEAQLQGTDNRPHHRRHSGVRTGPLRSHLMRPTRACLAVGYRGSGHHGGRAGARNPRAVSARSDGRCVASSARSSTPRRFNSTSRSADGRRRPSCEPANRRESTSNSPTGPADPHPCLRVTDHVSGSSGARVSLAGIRRPEPGRRGLSTADADPWPSRGRVRWICPLPTRWA